MNGTLTNKIKVQNALIAVIRVIIMFLFVLSTATTAIGLRGFVFDNILVCGVLSLVVQLTLIVVAFTMSRGKTWGRRNADGERKSGKAPLLMLAVYAGLLLISSGFSYVYISNSMYSFNWKDTVQRVTLREYREQLFENQSYVDCYLDEELNRLNQAIRLVDPGEEEVRQNSGGLDAVKQLTAPEGMSGERYFLKVKQAAEQAEAALANRVSAAIRNLDEELASTEKELEAEPDAQVMAEQVRIMIDYAQRESREQGAGGASGRLLEYVANLNREVKNYTALLEMREFLDHEVQTIGTVTEDLEAFAEAAMAADPELSQLDAIRLFWRERVEKLRNMLSTIPAYNGDNDALKGDHRARSSAALDELIMSIWWKTPDCETPSTISSTCTVHIVSRRGPLCIWPWALTCSLGR